jgi:hypothetical protein
MNVCQPSRRTVEELAMTTLFRNDTYHANAIGSAWSSSPLGDPTLDDPDRRAITGALAVFAAACAIAGCAAAGAVLFASHQSATAVVPAVTISDIAPQHNASETGQ